MLPIEIQSKLASYRMSVHLEPIPLGPEYNLDRVISSLYNSGCTLVDSEDPRLMSEGIQVWLTAWRLAYYHSRIENRTEKIRLSIVDQLYILGADSQYLKQLGLVV